MGQRSHVLADELSTHLRERILSGEYPPGSSVTETGIAAEYGVARPSARSALDRLVLDDLLVRQAHAALRVRQVSEEEVPEILALLEFLEERALSRVLDGAADLRPLRAAAGDSVHHYLHTLVRTSEFERLARFHRQTTFALILAPRGEDPAPAPPAHAMERLTEALFRLDAEDARARLGELQTARRTLATSRNGVSAAGIRT